MSRTTAFWAFVAALTCLVTHSIAAVVELDWKITWVSANPDGRLTRPVIGINNAWPPPTVQVIKGDRLLVHVTNALGNQTTTVHWHGLLQDGTNTMDGPGMITQCPIPPGMTYTYDFTVNQPGTYWYHSHYAGQYPDGLRGPLIVHDPQAPYAKQIDGELVLTFSDWYHDQMPSLYPVYLSENENPDGGEPVPYSGLLNDAPSGQTTIPVDPNKTYLLHIVSMATFAQSYIWIDGHDMTVVEVDGVYVDPKTTKAVYLATGQRYSVLIKTKGDKKAVGYPINAVMDGDKFDEIPDYVVLNTTAYLVYNSPTPKPGPGPGPSPGPNPGPNPDPKPGPHHHLLRRNATTAIDFLPAAQVDVKSLKTPDDMDFTPSDHMAALSGKPDHSVSLNLSFFNDVGMNLAGFNNMTYVSPKVPTLYTILNAPESEASKLTNAKVYGTHSNAWVVKKGDLVELVINNYDSGAHIMHLHGHTVQLMAKAENVNVFGGDGPAQPYNGGDNASQKFPKSPMRRDTWVLPPYGWSVVRFIANNPGVWLFHCHMEWHVAAGLTATMVTAPDVLRTTQHMDGNMKSICDAQHIPTTGNAAGNTKDYLNLDGEPTSPSLGQTA